VPGGEFGPGETAVARAQGHVNPTVAIDPNTGQPVVGFTQVADGGARQAAIARRRP
jgi:hypothetical protein